MLELYSGVVKPLRGPLHFFLISMEHKCSESGVVSKSTARPVTTVRQATNHRRQPRGRALELALAS